MRDGGTAETAGDGASTNADHSVLDALGAESTPGTEREVSVLFRGIGLDDITGQNYLTGSMTMFTDMAVPGVFMVTGGKIVTCAVPQILQKLTSPSPTLHFVRGEG